MSNAAKLDLTELRKAISNTVGAHIYNALIQDVGLVKLHDMACLLAFANRLDDAETDLLRDTYNQRQKDGGYMNFNH